MKVFLVVCFCCLLTAGVCSNEDAFNTTVHEMVESSKCYWKNLPKLMESCVIAPDEDLKLVKECFKEASPSLPCVVENVFDKKAVDSCVSDLMKDYSKVLELLDFIENIISKCPEKCILTKMDLLDGETLDTTKAAEKFVKYPLVEKAGLTIEKLKKRFDDYISSNAITDDFNSLGGRNFTTACSVTKNSVNAVYKLIFEVTGSCMNEECKKISGKDN